MSYMKHISFRSSTIGRTRLNRSRVRLGGAGNRKNRHPALGTADTRCAKPASAHTRHHERNIPAVARAAKIDPFGASSSLCRGYGAKTYP
ncbi:hypothetical protein CGRA01v4_10823 [Colletotrichum graminicola]|nr:hypothetical protein CGRA01v4_10823 [Colletotrichum graminicola]